MENSTQQDKALSPEQWESIQKQAHQECPLPDITSTLGAVYGFFGGGIFAALLLPYPSVKIPIASIICAIIGYFYFKTKEDKHYKAYIKFMNIELNKK